MYRIIAYDTPTDTMGRVVYDPLTGKQITEGKLTLNIQDIDTLEFSINRANPLYGKINPMQTHINVYQDKDLIFRGRVLEPKRAMDSTGLFSQTYAVESVYSYLLDSVQRYAEVHDTTPAEFFTDLIAVHNAQVEPYKQFKVGKITVTNSTDNVYRYVEYDNTLNTIKDKLLDRLGGYIKIRHETDGNYIDYLAESGKVHVRDNPLQIGLNMQDTKLDIDASTVITRFVPLGATLQPETTDGESKAAYPRLTIADVNDGKDYIDIPDLQAEFGVINGTNMWDDIKTSDALLNAAKSWIEQQSAATETWTVSAVDIDRFSVYIVGDTYTYYNSEIVKDVATVHLIKKEINFAKPNNSTLTFGEQQVTLSNYQNQNIQAIKRVNQLSTLVASQNAAIDNVKQSNALYEQQLKQQQSTVNSMRKQLVEIDLGNYGPIVTIKDGDSIPDMSNVRAFAVGVDASTFTYLNTNKLKYGVYHYLNATTVTEATAEATGLVSLVKSAGGTPLFYAIQVGSYIDGINDVLAAYGNALIAAGIPKANQILYTDTSLIDTLTVTTGLVWLKSHGGNDGTLGGATIPTQAFDLWEYTSQGSIGTNSNLTLSAGPSDSFKSILGGA